MILAGDVTWRVQPHAEPPPAWISLPAVLAFVPIQRFNRLAGAVQADADPAHADGEYRHIGGLAVAKHAGLFAGDLAGTVATAYFLRRRISRARVLMSRK